MDVYFHLSTVVDYDRLCQTSESLANDNLRITVSGVVMEQPILKSIQVGLPTTYVQRNAGDQQNAAWTTGFFKKPVVGSVHVGKTNIEGDRQDNLSVHGGIDKAVCAYSADHYVTWQTLLEMAELPYGAFGENLTVANLTEKDVCIGDVFQCGEVQFEVSQPRQPCWKLARRWQMKELPELVVKFGWSGWYFRVLEEGSLKAGNHFELVTRRYPQWTVQQANSVFHGKDLLQRDNLAALSELSESWKSLLF